MSQFITKEEFQQFQQYQKIANDPIFNGENWFQMSSDEWLKVDEHTRNSSLRRLENLAQEQKDFAWELQARRFKKDQLEREYQKMRNEHQDEIAQAKQKAEQQREQNFQNHKDEYLDSLSYEQLMTRTCDYDGFSEWFAVNYPELKQLEMAIVPQPIISCSACVEQELKKYDAEQEQKKQKELEEKLRKKQLAEQPIPCYERKAPVVLADEPQEPKWGVLAALAGFIGTAAMLFIIR